MAILPRLITSSIVLTLLANKYASTPIGPFSTVVLLFLAQFVLYQAYGSDMASLHQPDSAPAT